MSAADMAHALGEPRREGRGWRCRCPLHGGISLSLRDGDEGRLLVWCFGGCNSHDVLDELRRRRLLDGKTQPRDTITKAPPHEDDERKIARAAQATVEAAALPREACISDQARSSETFSSSRRRARRIFALTSWCVSTASLASARDGVHLVRAPPSA